MPKNKVVPRKSLFDDLQNDPNSSLYCNLDVLDNEASVEAFFINRMLKDLGYQDNQIQPKKSISELLVPLGSKKVNYKPDYVLMYKGTPKWVLDAKATNESLDNWIHQCSGYCLTLNQSFDDDNPVEYFVLSNGLLTRVYKWDSNKPLLELAFSDFNLGNPKYQRLQNLLAANVISKPKVAKDVQSQNFYFERPPLDKILRVFSECHNYIWKADKRSPSSAFMEFVKIMFVKLWADRELRKDKNIASLLMAGKRLPKSSITFSVSWIESRDKETPNPIDEIWFKQLRNTIEQKR